MCGIQIFVNQYSHKLYQSKYISLGFETSEDHKRKSYMTEALDGYLKNFFKRHPDAMVINGIQSKNTASQDLHIKFGFIPIESKSIDCDEYMISKLPRGKPRGIYPDKLRLTNIFRILILHQITELLHIPSYNSFINPYCRYKV